jgi:hypothetical protein
LQQPDDLDMTQNQITDSICTAILRHTKALAAENFTSPEGVAENAFSAGFLASFIAHNAMRNPELMAELIERGMINNKADDNTKKAKKLIRDVARANINSSNGKGVYK